MKTKIVGLVGMLFTFLPLLLSAQTSLNVPNDAQNTRFYSDVFNVQRPALGIAGFDNGGNHSKGYGLKQILNQVFITGSNEQKQRFIDVLTAADDPIELSPLDADEIETNSNILQYRAFEALCSFVLEENGVSSGTSSQTYGIPIRDHQTVLNSFTSNIMALVNGNLLVEIGQHINFFWLFKKGCNNL